MTMTHPLFSRVRSARGALSTLLSRGALVLSLVCGAWLLPAAIAPAQAADEYCFGASGQGCGGWTFGQMPRMAFCAPLPGTGHSICSVSGGSMTHDPCCVRTPNGVQCGGGGRETSQCGVEWQRAVHRAVWFYQWNRLIDTRRGNDTGVVERLLYCANRGAGVHKNDTGYCCNRTARQANIWERVARPDLHICT